MEPIGHRPKSMVCSKIFKLYYYVYYFSAAHYLSLGDKYVQQLRILSSSMDKTCIIWEPEGGVDGVWNDTVR